MKKTYEKPFAEKVEFDYSSQVVATSGTNYTNYGRGSCTDQVPTNSIGTGGCYA